jgi:hypothetical protein
MRVHEKLASFRNSHLPAVDFRQVKYCPADEAQSRIVDEFLQLICNHVAYGKGVDCGSLQCEPAFVEQTKILNGASSVTTRIAEINLELRDLVRGSQIRLRQGD